MLVATRVRLLRAATQRVLIVEGREEEASVREDLEAAAEARHWLVHRLARAAGTHCASAFRR